MGKARLALILLGVLLPTVGARADSLDAARRRSVVVRFYVKPNPEDLPGQSRYIPSLGAYQSFIEAKKPVETSGVILSGDRILVADFGFDERYLDYIEVETGGGKRFRARLLGFLKGAPALFIAPAEGEFPADDLPPFEEANLTDATAIYGIKLQRTGTKWELRRFPLDSGLRFDTGKRVFYTRLKVPYCVLISDGGGRLLGCATGYWIDDEQSEGLWKGKDLLNAGFVPREDLVRLRSEFKQRFSKLLALVRVEFDEKCGEVKSRGALLSLVSRASRARTREIRCYGIPVTQRLVFAPLGLKRRDVARLKRVTLEVGGDKFAGELIGAYRDFEGFVVRSSKALPPFPCLFEGAEPREIEPFYCVEVKAGYGGMNFDIFLNRYLYTRAGFGNKPVAIPMRRIPRGALLLDSNSRPMGVYLCERHGDEEEKWVQESARRGYSYTEPATERLRIFSFTELRECLTEPKRFLDKRMVVLAPEQNRKRAWLGVEFVRMTPALAKKFNCSAETKDGKIGLVVSNVYPDSPAEAMGLKVGDVLLSLKEQGKKFPIELVAPTRVSMVTMGLRDLQTRTKSAGRAGLVTPWLSRENYLTLLLDAIGIGKKVTLRFFSDGRVRESEFEIAEAPPDFESAPSYCDEALGLTVKDVTYEVRLALNLPHRQGVVVAKVDSGSASAVARIAPFQVITQADGQPVRNARHFRTIVERARAAKKTAIPVVVLSLGESRIVDLSLR